jgi:2-dehydropantoate 2-reductase
MKPGESAMSKPIIVVAGAGAVGCFVGGLLAAAGREVKLLGRERVVKDVATRGLHISDFTGLEVTARPVAIGDPRVLASANVILVCVKGGATEEIGRLIGRHGHDDAVVVSLQNGVGNADLLRQALPGRDVRAGIVGFNVVALGDGRYHRSVSGEIMVEAGPGGLGRLLRVPGLVVDEVREIKPLQRGKQILNLTNAVNALSGLRLREMLLQRGWRRVMAAQMAEALKVYRKAGLGVVVPASVPGWAIPWLLRLPTPLFRRIAEPMLTVDSEARTSMVVDLETGRKTEIDLFQGDIVRLGQKTGVATPVNARVAELVRAAGRHGVRPHLVAEMLD